ncbi:MAG: hypothetical protein ABIW47_14390, partial [Ginsengibacter sp.]
ILNAIVTTFNIEINCAKPEVPYLNFIEDYCFSFKDINDKDKYCYFPIVFILSEEWYLQLQKVSKTIKKNIEQTSFNKSDLLKDVGNILGKPIEEYVFATPKYSANNIKDISSLNDYLHTIYSTNFSDAKSSLFEILYTSYILRRITKVDLVLPAINYVSFSAIRNVSKMANKNVCPDRTGGHDFTKTKLLNFFFKDCFSALHSVAAAG